MRNSATAQQRHCATAPLRNSATAQLRRTAELNNATTLQGSFILALSLYSPPSPFCKAQQQRNRSLILDPHLRSSIHRALRNSVTAQQRHCATASLRNSTTAQQRHCATEPLRNRATTPLRNSATAQQRHCATAPLRNSALLEDEPSKVALL